MVKQRKKIEDGDVETTENSELGDLMSQVNKSMGDRFIIPAKKLPDFTVVDSGIFLLDYALLGGLGQSSINMIYGYEASGKTTVALRYIAGAQRKYPDKKALFVDLEGTFDCLWAEACGIDLDRLYVARPDTGEQAVDMIEGAMLANDASIIVMDSMPALSPSKILTKSAEDATMAERARLLGTLCTKCLSAISKGSKKGHRPIFLMINQFRTNIATMFGDKRMLPGGQQPKYACRTMIEIKKVKEHLVKSESGSEIVDYNDVAFKIKKHKSGMGIAAGEFKLVRNATNELGSAAIDEVQAVSNIARKYSLQTGAGSSHKLVDVDEKFTRLSEVYSYLLSNNSYYLNLKRALISMRRQELGMSATPKDGYLLSWS